MSMTEVKTIKPHTVRAHRAPRARKPAAPAIANGAEAPLVAVSSPAKYFSAVGRRKEASAQVRIFPQGKGEVTVNGKPFMQYFPVFSLQQAVLQPFLATGRADEFDASVKVRGGGVRGQAEAVRLGIARALVKFNESLKPALRKAGFLTRDARVRERKKYGLKSARRAPQWAKR